MITMQVNITANGETGSGKIASVISALPDADTKRQAFAAVGQFLVAKTKDNIAGHTGPDGPWPTSSLSDFYAGPRIWQDIASAVQFDATENSVTIGVAHVAGAVRQLGTKGAGGELPDIVPVKKKALTIPISDVASRASYSGRDARTAFKDAFVLKKPGGQSAQTTGILVRKVGGRTDKKTGEKKGQKYQMLYLLVKKAAIRPHRFLPFDRQSQIAPDGTWQEIAQLLLDVYAPPAPPPAVAGGTA